MELKALRVAGRFFPGFVYIVNEALFFLLITSHLRPSLVCLLRVCLNLGEGNDTMDSSVSNA